jgi:Peptidase family S41
MLIVCALAACTSAVTRPDDRAGPSDLSPWLEDLATLETGLARNYANFEDALVERRIDLLNLSFDAKRALTAASNDDERRKALVALVDAFADPHAFVEVPTKKTRTPHPACSPEVMERAARKGMRFERLPSFARLDGAAPALFGAGTAQLSDKRTFGIVRIPSFVPVHYFQLCKQAAAAAGIMPAQPCDSNCEDKLDRAIGRALSDALQEVLQKLERMQPAAIAVDLTDNGGGNDWAEVAARIIGGALRSPEVGLLKHPAWLPTLDEKRREIEAALSAATGEWRERLIKSRELVMTAADEVRHPCDLSSAWTDPELARGSKRLPCTTVVRGLYFSSGPEVHANPPAGNNGSEEVLFTGARYGPYQPGIVRRSLFVFVNRNTYSAAELVAAMLQDSGRAKIVGEVTAGAGCGHATEAGTDFTLPRSSLRVRVPDCVRYRSDGTNERRGVTPNVLVPWGPSDSAWQHVTKAVTSLAAAL